MEEIRSYILSITTATLIAALVLALVQNSSCQPVIHLICGMFLCAVVLRPFSGRLPEISLNLTPSAVQQDRDYAYEGSEAAQNAMADIITEELEAYILDKAASLNVSVEVAVTLDHDLLPSAASVTGDIPSAVQKELEQFLEAELGILKENQKWTG